MSIDPDHYDRLMLERDGVAVALLKDEDELRLNIQTDDGHLEIRTDASVFALKAMLDDLLGEEPE